MNENGFKFKIELHDAYKYCAPEKFGLIEVKREEEFALIKNPPGSEENSPDSVRVQISELHKSWLKRHSVKFEGSFILLSLDI
mgnify:CR=1 FL=1